MRRRKKPKKIKTKKIKCLAPTKIKKDACFLTMRRARRCSNYISQKIQENKIDTFNYDAKSIVDDFTYQDCHRYKIPTALIQSQRDKVIEATNSWVSNGKEGHPPYWRGIPSMRLDSRTLTIKRKQDKWIFWLLQSKGKSLLSALMKSKISGLKILILTSLSGLINTRHFLLHFVLIRENANLRTGKILNIFFLLILTLVELPLLLLALKAKLKGLSFFILADLMRNTDRILTQEKIFNKRAVVIL